MKNIYFVLFFFFLFLQVSFVSAYNACRQGTLPVYFECQDSSCNSTETKFYPRDSSKQNYIIYHGAIKKNYDLLEYLEDNNKNFIEENYCENPNLNSDKKLSCSRVYDKTVKVTDMIYATHNIYLITGTKDSSGKYPQGSYKKFDNGKEVLNYYNTKVNVPRVCLDSDCNPTKYKNYLATTNPNFTVLKSGNKKEITLTEIDEPDVISWGLSGTNYKIGLNSTPIYINAKFRDYFPTGCNNPITYKLQSIDPLGGVNMEFSDSVSYDNNNITITKKTDNYIEWEVREGFRFNTVGSNYIKAIFTDGFPNSITRTTIPTFIDVSAGDVAQEKSFIKSYQQRGPDFKYFAKMDGNEGSTLFYDFYLKDISGNPISLPVKIRPTNNTDKIIEYPSGNISGDAQGKYSFSLKFNNKTSTYIEEFDIIVPKTDNFGAITSNYITIKLSANPQPLPIYSVSETSSDFPIGCTNRNILFRATCTWDNLSGCRAVNDSTGITLESQNGTEGVLYVRDRAGNATNGFKWKVDHLDKTKPSISNIKFNGDTDSIKADNSTTIDLDLNDYTPNGCTPKIDYTLNINNLKTTKSKTGTTITPYNFYFPYDFSKTGNASVGFTLRDAAGNVSYTGKTIKIYPNNFSSAYSQVSLIDASKNNTLYPGSSYNYQVYLKDKYGNSIYNKTIDSISYLGSSALKTNMTDINTPSGENIYSLTPVNSVTDINGKATFNFKSLAPGIFNETFGIRLNSWDDNYSDLGSDGTVTVGSGGANYFLKPRTATMSALTPGGTLKLNSDNKIKLSLSDKLSPTFPGYTVENFKDKLSSSQTSHSISRKNDVTSTNSDPIMTFKLEANSDNGVNIKPGVKVNPFISYELEGKTISYLLSPDKDPTDETSIGINNPKEALSGVRIVGSSQGSGKQALATGKGKFSDVSKSDTRTKIRKTAYDLIKSRKSGTNINGVFYQDCTNKSGVDQEFKISLVSSDITYITKNCNIIIDSNTNTSGKRLGIIALRDNQSKEEIGNIYVKPNVNYINAIIYADGGFISTGFDGGDRISNYVDNLDRTEKLQKQLVLKGTLFTRNTIGGAIKGSSTYLLLPGGAKTNSYDKAMAYDLNYIRRENSGWSVPNSIVSKYNLGYPEPFVIVYNPILQSNPPKGFK